MEINSTLLRERLPVITLAANGPVGAAATTVDIVSHIGVSASAANLTFTVPNPTDTRSGLDFMITNTGANTFTVLGMRVDPNRFGQFIWDATELAWQSPAVPLASGADFFRSGSLTGLMPDGTTDTQDAIYRSGQVVIDTGNAADSGLTLDDLRGMTAGYGPTDGTLVTAIGVDPTGKVRLSNSIYSTDSRAVNDTPDQYSAGYYVEFKQATTIGFDGVAANGPLSGQTYIGLETFRRYAQGTDFSGGPVQQRVQMDDGREFYRNSLTATTWTPWTVKTNLQSEFDLQDLLTLNGTAKVSLAGEVTWVNRFITMTAGVTPQEASGYHDIILPAVGALIPVSNGSPRTVVAATAGQSGATGGIALAAWETLWYRAVRGSANASVPGNFLITYYTTPANTAAPGILNEASYPGTHAGEWIRVVSRDDGNKFRWGTGDVVGLGGQFGGGHSLNVEHWSAMKARATMSGYAFATFASSVPTRVGFSGTIRWMSGGTTAYVDGQGFVDNTPAGRTNGTVVYGVNGAANRTWETLTAADAVTKFGGAQRGVEPITAASTVVNVQDNETLYYAPDTTTGTAVNGGTWYIAGYTGTVTIPTHWLPVIGYTSTGAASTAMVLVGGVQRSLRSGEAIWLGKADGDIDRLHRRMGVTYTGLKYTRFTQAGFFAGAAANGFIQGAEGVLVSWEVDRMIYGVSDGYASWGNQYTFINVPPAGTAIPVANTNGAVALTRVVQNISGRAYIPLSGWESLWFIPPAYIGGSSSVAGDFVISHYNGNHNVPPGAVRVAHVNSAASLSVGSGIGKARVTWADNTVTQPGVSLASATAALRVENDHAQGSGDWRAVTVAGQTGPGMTAAMPAVAGVVGNYSAPFTANYRYLPNDQDPRGQIEVEGILLLNNNIVGTQNIAFLTGVQVRGNPITMNQMTRSTDQDTQPIPVQLRWTNGNINGQNGVIISIVNNSGNTTNNYATLAANGGAGAPGVPQWVALGPTILPHA